MFSLSLLNSQKCQEREMFKVEKCLIFKNSFVVSYRATAIDPKLNFYTIKIKTT